MLFALMVYLSAQMATHAVNLLQGSMAAVLFHVRFAVVMENTAVQKDTPAILQLELVTKKVKPYICYRRCHP